MNDAITQYYERARMLMDNQTLQDLSVPAATVAAVLLLVLGLGTSVLGAKVARGSYVVGFAALGLLLGSLVGRYADVPQGIAALLGAGTLGVVGFALHRLWVGLSTALLIIVAVNATYGVYAFAPHLHDYEHTYGTFPPVLAEQQPRGLHERAGPDADEQTPLLNPELRSWFHGFWNYAHQKDPGGLRRLAFITFSGGLFGFLLGLTLVRFTLVTTTSIVGTAMLTSGAGGLARQFQPEFYEASLRHPQAIGIACAAFLVGSIILQTLLTRTDKTARSARKS